MRRGGLAAPQPMTRGSHVLSGWRRCYSSSSSGDDSRDLRGEYLLPGERSRGWDDGTNEGYEWRLRHLTERRREALDYMINVHRRAPIHDAIRTRCHADRERLRNLGDVAANGAFTNEDLTSPNGALLHSLGVGTDGSGATAGAHGTDEHLLDLLELPVWGEGGDDSLMYIPEEELQWLRDEFYGSASPAAEEAIPAARQDDLLRAWCKLRTKREEHQRYTAIPKEERTLWAPWYLKDLSR